MSYNNNNNKADYY